MPGFIWKFSFIGRDFIIQEEIIKVPEIKFNYIVTIHNKEMILEETLNGLKDCCSERSKIYPVLDGCTDRSEQIVDEFSQRTGLNVEKIYASDVHEIKSINLALKKIDKGFTVCLQDDVVLKEPDLERKIRSLYEREGSKLGVVSFCRAANLKRTPLIRQFRRSGLKPLVIECDEISAVHDYAAGCDKIEYEELVYRMVAIKSPVCIPERVLKSVGILDENLAPYSWDDHEYCMRALKAGFRNALFPLRFVSELEWGGTRIDKNFSKECHTIHLRNRQYIWEKHGQFIDECIKTAL